MTLRKRICGPLSLDFRRQCLRLEDHGADGGILKVRRVAPIFLWFAVGVGDGVGEDAAEHSLLVSSAHRLRKEDEMVLVLVLDCRPCAILVGFVRRI